MPPHKAWRDLSDEVLESVSKPKPADYVYRCQRCGLEVCRCGTLSLSEVKPGIDHLIITGTIVDAGRPAEVETKYGRTTLTRAFLQDPSGRVRLSLWGEHAKKVGPGDVVRIENAFASMFRDELQINLGWRGIVLLAKSSDSTVTLERELGYTFKKTELLIQALTRRSYANEHPGEKTKTSEPLSFLGDAVLDLAVSEHLVSENPELTEGQLTNRFQGLASELQCAAAGTKLRLYNYLRLGGGEKPLAQTANFMAEAYEALIGALFFWTGSMVPHRQL